MALQRLDHYNIETVRPDETVAFYCDVLGCVNAPERRPAVPEPGTWLLVDDHPAIHVNFVEYDLAARTGAIDHVAFEASGYLEMCAQLDTLGVDYDAVESPQFDLLQIYVIDPNRIRVEINIRGEAEHVAAARNSN
ncbi:MAG: glyoxalase [Acidimicrobiia bacterium]|nr:glyoxalase [Acidimicrobiia bacterium]